MTTFSAKLLNHHHHMQRNKKLECTYQRALYELS
jgi:hypothetical protein